MTATSGLNAAVSLDTLRLDLARELGFSDYPKSRLASPYLNYVENQHKGQGSLEEYLDLFKRIVRHFSQHQVASSRANAAQHAVTNAAAAAAAAQQGQSQIAPRLDPNGIEAFIISLCSSPSEPLFSHTSDSVLRKELVTEAVMYILGVWVAMLNYFIELPVGYRQIELAFHFQQILQGQSSTGSALEGTLQDLLNGSNLLPHSEESRQLQSSPGDNLQAAVHDLLSMLPPDNQPLASASSSQTSEQQLRAALLSFVSRSNSGSGGGIGSGNGNGSSRNTTSNHTTFPTFLSSSAGGSSRESQLSLLHTSIDSLESLLIKRTALNAHTLSALGDVQIHWTQNLSRHLLLSRFAGKHVLELFALPCVLEGGSRSLRAAGIAPALMHEIQASYAGLFNPLGGGGGGGGAAGAVYGHGAWSRVVLLEWWCWCLACSCKRLRRRELAGLKTRSPSLNTREMGSEYDPFLEELMASAAPEDWSHELFPHLWSRIIALQEHLVVAKPWSFWVLFRDRRDTLQFWTFFFATLILVLTVVQIGLGIAQVVGSF